MIKIVGMEESRLKSLKSLASALYLEGQSFEFAIGLHQALGWEMFGLWDGDKLERVTCRDRDGVYWDVRGRISPADPANNGPGQPPAIPAHYRMRPVTAKEIRQIRPIGNEDIERAIAVAQAMWPNLPWRDGTYQRTVVEFMTAIEGICRRYGFWIKAPNPNTPIVLYQAEGTENGFKVTPSMDGQYTFDFY